MKNTFLIGSLLVSLVSVASASELKLIHSKELHGMLGKKEATVTVYDANSPETRASEGVVPGAKLLTSYKDYSVEKELPKSKDANLVFYCANTQCMASHTAAERAIKAGYANVSVFADGIQGWKKAGYPTTKPVN